MGGASGSTAQGAQPGGEAVHTVLAVNHRLATVQDQLVALEHGTEHRTEIRIGLELVGATAPELDGWEFAASAGYGTETQP
jgi:hypothetical protein